jgi:hypothetical protein
LFSTAAVLSRGDECNADDAAQGEPKDQHHSLGELALLLGHQQEYFLHGINAA